MTSLANCNVAPPIESDQVIIFGKPKDAVSLDPADVTDGESSAVVVNIFEPLIRFQREKTSIEPALAESWEFSDDKLTWTFHLRKGVTFHDGTPLNAEAVKFNYDRQKDEDNPYRFKGKFEYWHGFFKSVKSIEAKDEHTVVMTLKHPDATFLINLGIFTMGISSPTAIKKHGEDYFKHPVGTGPYKFDKWRLNEKIVLQRNDNYWGEKAKIKMLIFKPVADNSVRLLGLELGNIHVLDGINPDDVERIQRNPDLNFITQPGLNVGFLSLNNLKPPFDNKKVRQAVHHAINKEALVKAFFAGGTLGEAATNPIPKFVFGYNDQIKGYTYDPAKAKALLAEAGFPNGFKAKLWAMPIARPYMPQPRQIATAIQANLKEVGIDTDIVSYDWGTYLDKVSKGEHEMALGGWIGDNGDPDNFLYTLLDKHNTDKEKGASNYQFYRDERVSALLNEAQRVYDQKQRAELYKKSQEYIIQDSPMVPLFHSTQMAATVKGVEGYYLHPVGEKRFHDIYWKK